ncbi:MAG: hypothetical protein HY738_18080 [Bacteroidia bacterium]|nr:hypothetical protein [Bacteroidia bacterium]
MESSNKIGRVRAYWIASLIFFLVFIQQSTNAQQIEEPAFRTIFSRQGGTDWGLTVGPELLITKINDKPQSSVCHKFDMIINRQYSIGIFINPNISNQSFVIEYDTVPDSTYNLKINQFGIGLKYIFFKKKFLHVSVHVYLGGGFVNIRRQSVNATIIQEKVDSSSYLSIEPGLMLEFDLGRFFHIGFGFTYRDCFGTRLNMIKEEEFDGLAFRIGLRIGRYY